jgi:hypothetical protein
VGPCPYTGGPHTILPLLSSLSLSLSAPSPRSPQPFLPLRPLSSPMELMSKLRDLRMRQTVGVHGGGKGGGSPCSTPLHRSSSTDLSSTSPWRSPAGCPSSTPVELTVEAPIQRPYGSGPIPASAPLPLSPLLASPPPHEEEGQGEAVVGSNHW